MMGEQRKKTNRSAWRLKFQFYRGTDDIYRFYLNTCLARQFAKRHKAGYAKASELTRGCSPATSYARPAAVIVA